MAGTRRGPLITLGAVVLLVGLLLAVNAMVRPPTAPTSSPQATPTAPVEPSAASPSPTESAPQPTTEPALREAVYTGRTGDGEATVAVVVSGDRAAAYLCDGASIETWLDGSVDGDQITLTGQGSASLTGSTSGATMSGSITTATGLGWPFAADLAQAPAGIYEFRAVIEGLATRIGWVVLPDGTQVGIRNDQGSRSPAPELDPAEGVFTVDGTSYRAATISGSDTVVSR